MRGTTAVSDCTGGKNIRFIWTETSWRESGGNEVI